MEKTHEHKSGTGNSEHPQNAEFDSLSGPMLGTRAVVDALAWGKANHYLADLSTYADSPNLDRPEVKELIVGRIGNHFQRLGLLDRHSTSVPGWEDVQQTRLRIERGWMESAHALGSLATYIAGIRTGHGPIGEMNREWDEESLGAWDPAYRSQPLKELLAANFDRALRTDKVQLEYDARYQRTTDKSAKTLMLEYPLLVTQFEYAVVSMIVAHGNEFRQERQLFVNAIHTMRQCRPSTVAYLVKLEHVLASDHGFG